MRTDEETLILMSNFLAPVFCLLVVGWLAASSSYHHSSDRFLMNKTRRNIKLSVSLMPMISINLSGRFRIKQIRDISSPLIILS